MFSLGDTVLYATTGVCVVDSIEKKKIGKLTKEYYVLKPVAQSSSTVFVPVDNEVLTSKMRELITKQDIEKILGNTDVLDLWIDDEGVRREEFAKVVVCGERSRQFALARTLRKKQLGLSEKNKRLHIADERVFKEVLRIIVDEFSFVLGISPKEVEEIIYK